MTALIVLCVVLYLFGALNTWTILEDADWHDIPFVMIWPIATIAIWMMALIDWWREK